MPAGSHTQPVRQAAYGGPNWSARTQTHREEIGGHWLACGQSSEFDPLQAVLLHPPGPELAQPAHPDDAQLLQIPDWERARQQHQSIAAAYRASDVSVSYINPQDSPSPNLIFCADLCWLTPEGAILARPASTVRAGEERQVARRLADLGIPILRTLTGTATFEGADAMWLDPETALLGRGLRTNAEGLCQVSATLAEIGVRAIPVDLPVGSMHLMGVLRILDHDLALAWPYRLAWAAAEALQARGYRLHTIPDEAEASHGGALNFVSLGPRQVLMAAGNPITQAFLENLGVRCQTVAVDELLKAAGGIGCLSAVLKRR